MDHLRLLVASSRASILPVVKDAIRSNVILVLYEYESCTLEDILVLIKTTLSKTLRVASIALLMHCSETEIFICFSGGKVLSAESMSADQDVQHFMRVLVDSFMLFSRPTRRLDILNSCPSKSVLTFGDPIAHELQKLLRVPVGIWSDIIGAESGPTCSQPSIDDLYFNIVILREKLLIISNTAGEARLDGYEKIRTVGKGAFGTAVLYRKLSDDCLVVIKEINMLDLTAAERQMALNEAQVLSVLHHTNIIRYLGSFEQNGMLMIEMEYADKGTLSHMLSHLTTRMEEKDILILFTQIVKAIKYMHDHNILHRDLKTANVFLMKDNTIKVGDFGISKVMTTRLQAQTVLGTPYYISPEMCEGKQYNEKSDIWALGCILYEMACLQKTFEGSNLPALVNKIMKEDKRLRNAIAAWWSV